ncbi:hypothetical protein FRY98_22755 [Paenibacillus faecis]|uniref:Uncharacterized protein n=1 Tax=Paenibacillus faecis TaxID=862114 RepID=A0A5D0CM44_9BACL|nr:SIR2 family protein [Paenibacillus faecis]TYA10620.1 hypothetical protein FRY98_22755 [Paenibacillus faecis]
MSVALELLKRNNEYPIVFIGSGMSKRYLQSFPGWEELLKQFWDQLNTGKDFYGFLSTLKRHMSETTSDTEYDVDFLTNIQAGSEIEDRFNEKFFHQEIEIPGFDTEKAYKFDISPFKMAIAHQFSSYQVKKGMEEEYASFKTFLNKTQIVITTNYDTFIEDSVNSVNPLGMKKYIGQKGFFESTYGWAEIYKIHGCATNPKSIVISKADYAQFSKNSILISAKIISLLLHSPIIFFGYSLTDGNVRKILRDFSSSLSKEELKRLASKIIIVEWEKGQTGIVEQTFFDTDLGCEYTVLRTDNYKLLYEILSEIDQGIHPSEVRKYQHVIKQLILDRGKKGSLNTLLVSPEELEDIEKRIGDEKLVVALGDTTYIFQMPDLLTYLFDYFFGGRSIHTDIALRFIASQNSNSRIPFIKYVEGIDLDKTNLHPVEIEKINQRIAKFTGPQICLDSINPSNRIKADSLKEILEQQLKPDKEYDLIAYNAPKLDKQEVGTYLKEKLEKFKADGIRSVSTSMRRLLTIYDFIENK